MDLFVMARDSKGAKTQWRLSHCDSIEVAIECVKDHVGADATVLVSVPTGKAERAR